MGELEKTIFGAVIVLYNPTEKEIKNINLYKDLVEKTIIIDNSATNHCELVDSLLKLNSRVQYYSEQKNLGLCKALNLGIKMLSDAGCQWALVFDADSEIASDIVMVYKKAIDYYKMKKKNDIAIFAPVHVFDRSKRHSYHGYNDVEWAMTSGCLFNCEFFQKQNGFMEELFVDGLDIDYSFKSKKNGYRIIECGEAVINHHPAETKSLFGIKYGIASPDRYYMQARALIWCWKYYKVNKLFLVYMYKWFKVILLFPQKKQYIKNMVYGTIEGEKLLKKYGRNKNGK